MVRGYTVESLQKRLKRLDSLQANLDVVYGKLYSFVTSRYEKHTGAVKQAIADRYATIRNAQEEISQLEKLANS